MALAKGLKPLQVFGAILFVRILSVFVVQTWYVPDEYWQTLEVAHKQVFGYGALTWEWSKGIRSYLYPSVVAAFYAVLKFTGLDHPLALILLPRILQASLSAVADYSFYQWTGGRKWALFLILTSWFWFYTASRTLLQTVETALVTIALSKFPFKDGKNSFYEKEKNTWIWLAFVCVFLRPTSAALWAVFGAYNLLTTKEERLRLLVRTYVPIGLVTGGALVALDSYFHGSLIVTPWEFFRFNVLHDIASFYGQHPWHWYLSQGIPAVLGITLLPVLAGTASALRRPKDNRTQVLLLVAAAVHVVLFRHWYLSQGIPAVLGITLLPVLAGTATALRRPKDNRTQVLLLVAAAVHVVLFSFVPHKEFRFVLPLLPIFLYLAQDFVVPWSRKALKWQLYLAAGLLLAGNALPALYFGQVHQSGTLRVMPLLREAITDNSSIAFLMPCHSTPLYSHLHANVTTRYLNCDPPLGKIGETHESEAFFNNPQRWWRNEYLNKATPTFVVLFDKLKGRVEVPLQGYKPLYELPHTQFPEGEVGEKVLVYKKIDQSKPRVDDAV